MNCQDITRILDDSDIGRLDPATVREVEAHLAGCPDCARAWQIHQSLAAPVPAVPPELAVHCRDLVAAGATARNGRRASSRVILLGTVMAVAAAAAMLVVQWQSSAKQTVTTVDAASAGPADEPPASASDAEAQIFTPAGEIAVPLPAEGKPVPVPDTSPEPAPAKPPGSFTVRLLTAQPQDAGANDQLLLETLLQDFAGALRRVPDLNLLTPGSDGWGTTDADYEVTISLFALRPGAARYARIIAGKLFPADARRIVAPVYGSMREYAATMVSEVVVGDAAAASEGVIDLLRMTFFPATAALKQELANKLRASRPSVQVQQMQVMRLPSPDADGRPRIDAADLRAVLEQATVAADPAARRMGWGQLRGTRHPDLVAQIETALTVETDDKVRLQMVTLLAADFSQDPQARGVLESAVRNERTEIVRMAAQRGLSGDAAWSQYMIATLKNTTLTDAQRLEPVEHFVTSSVSRPAYDALDEESLRAMGGLIVRQARDGQAASAMIVAQLLSANRSPVVRDVLIDILQSGREAGNGATALRWNALQALGTRMEGDAAVRAAVTDAAANDPEPRIRARAAALLDPPKELSLPQ